MTSYIESAAGVVAGGRSGVTAIVTGLLFVLALFIAPLVGAVPAAATAPALIVVGSLMMSEIGAIPWKDAGVAIPAFLTLVAIPLTFSIANGLAFGFTAYALLSLARGEFRRTHWLVYVLAALIHRPLLLSKPSVLALAHLSRRLNPRFHKQRHNMLPPRQNQRIPGHHRVKVRPIQLDPARRTIE